MSESPECLVLGIVIQDPTMEESTVKTLGLE